MSFLKIKLFVIAAIVFAASSAFADISYLVNVDTSSLQQSATSGYLYLNYTPGDQAPQASTATVSSFSTTGTLGAQDFSFLGNGSAVSGTLPSSVTFANTNQTNDYNQAITFGSNLSFVLTLSGATTANSDASGVFNLYLFSDVAGSTPLLTGDGLMASIGLNNNGSSAILSTSSQTQAQATPIPAAAWLLGSGLMGLAGIRRRQNG
jgi:hypothetical protein